MKPINFNPESKVLNQFLSYLMKIVQSSSVDQLKQIGSHEMGLQRSEGQ